MVHRERLFAHRGDPAHAPENTWASFKAALGHGAQGVEGDVRRTADGVWIVFHDAQLRRTTDLKGPVARTPWRVLRKADAGSWFSPRFRGEPILRLSDFLNRCHRHQLAVFLDVKVNGNERELAQLLKRSAALSQIAIGAGKKESLRRWRRFLPETDLFWVTGDRQRVTRRLLEQAAGLGLAGMAAYRRWVDRESVSYARQAGLKLYVWTAHTPGQLKRLVRLEVDGIMSEVWPCPSI